MAEDSGTGESGSPGSHDGRNWRPGETIEDYIRNCREGLETWSLRRAAKLLRQSRADLWRARLIASLPEDLFEALIESSSPPSPRELANIGRALRGDRMREVERCPHCGGLLRVRNLCSPKSAVIVNRWLAGEQLSTADQASGEVAAEG